MTCPFHSALFFSTTHYVFFVIKANLQVQNNKLSGSLPDNLYQLEKLEYLVGDNNYFSGSIQPGIGSLSQLVVLSFRENELTGTIPEELSNLTLLGTFQLALK